MVRILNAENLGGGAVCYDEMFKLDWERSYNISGGVLDVVSITF